MTASRTATTEWLIDKSALVRLGEGPHAADWADRIERGLVRIATVTLLEIGYSARSAADLRKGSAGTTDRRDARRVLHTPHGGPRPRRADHVGRTGQHRAPSTPDLMIAAIAELAGLTVLHDDKDFDLVAALTGQAVQRVDPQP